MQAVDLSNTITPKSDQLNADDLMTCDKVITVTEVKLNSSDDQPVSVHYQGDDGRPFKPCKSMRRVLITAWGPRADQWVGKSMRLYCDKSVRFGKDAVGGIRVSELTDIEKDLALMLTVTRGRKAEYRVKKMDRPKREPLSPAAFKEKLPAITKWIEGGDGTPEQAIARLERDNELTPEQRGRIRNIGGEA
jgi:hypothetical protein